MAFVVGPSRNRIVQMAMEGLRKVQRQANRIHKVLTKPAQPEPSKKNPRPSRASGGKNRR